MLKSALAGLSRVANTIAIAANAAGTLAVLGLVVILNVDVVARGVFSAPLKGTYEIVQLSVVLIVFLQLADVVRVDRLTRSDGFLNVVHNRRPKMAANMRRIINAVSAIFMGLIAYIMFPEFLKMWETQDYFGVPGLFTAPWWPIKLVIASGCALSCVIFTLKVITAQDRPHLVRAPEHDEPET
ncbi:TRAP transporter small permease subunit [Meridianimarinicoccus aquatilis]|uniref:TRAP transporter small permease protein n=1 Tax=Meridianimarinicoccus aquatilis TaxID=2552766 RepID=A0A4R6B2L9_9RHOB|nr:TRAP transporter small permease [Fluviibacterium aquatile]QIE42507.1 TRAP transporter small permease subunit [Rhodobacteraceae bacterium SC52]TDL89126.1 TRAP transporter small permease subunit [Fluviibacterium aquatile]